MSAGQFCAITVSRSFSLLWKSGLKAQQTKHEFLFLSLRIILLKKDPLVSLLSAPINQVQVFFSFRLRPVRSV